MVLQGLGPLWRAHFHGALHPWTIRFTSPVPANMRSPGRHSRHFSSQHHRHLCQWRSWRGWWKIFPPFFLSCIFYFVLWRLCFFNIKTEKAVKDCWNNHRQHIESTTQRRPNFLAGKKEMINKDVKNLLDKYSGLWLTQIISHKNLTFLFLQNKQSNSVSTVLWVLPPEDPCKSSQQGKKDLACIELLLDTCC